MVGKRFIVTDALGLLFVLLVMSASVRHRDGPSSYFWNFGTPTRDHSHPSCSTRVVDRDTRRCSSALNLKLRLFVPFRLAFRSSRTHAGRATQPAGLAAGYLATLLDDFDRTLTPREIVQAFYKNPAFPMITSTDEVRHVLYELLSSDWELVDADGYALAIAGPEQIAITSIYQTLRRRSHNAPGYNEW